MSADTRRPGRLPRSYLFVPGNRPERFAKALASGAEAVIVDLEDAVPPDEKESARRSVAEWLIATDRTTDTATDATPDARLLLRLNAVGTPWYRDDRTLCTDTRAVRGLSAVMLAKVEAAEPVAAFVAAVPGVPIVPLIESAAGIDRLREIAAAPGVQRLAFGAIDFQLDLNLQAGYDELIAFRSMLVLASRVANLAAPIDSPSTSMDGADEVGDEARRARRLGFGAKLCIHPRQVEAVNTAFRPSAAELEWARRVVEAARASGGAAVALDGRMIDKPVILRAEVILQDAAERD